MRTPCQVIGERLREAIDRYYETKNMIDAGLEDARGRTTDLGYQYEAELRRDKREWKRYERYIKRAHEYKRGFDEDAYYVSGDEMPMFGNRGRSRKGHRKVIEEDDDEDPFFARSRHHRHPSRHHSRPRSNVRHAEYSGGYGQRAPMNHYEYEYVPTYQYEDIGQDHSGRHGGRHRGGGFGDHHKSGRRHPSPAEGHHHTSRHEHSRRHCSPFHDGHQKSGHDHRRRSPNPFFADYSEHEHRHGKRHPKQSHYQSGHGRGRRAHGMGSSPEDDEGLFDDEEDAPHRNYGGPYGGFAGGSYIPPRGHHHFEGFADGSHVPPPPYDGFAGGSYVPPRGHHHFEGFADGSHAPPPRGARGHRKHRSDQEGMPNGGAATADDRPIDHYATLGISPQSSEEEIKEAAKKMRIQTHPDMLLAKEGLTDEEKANINAEAAKVGQAAEILSNRRQSSVHTTTLKYGDGIFSTGLYQSEVMGSVKLSVVQFLWVDG